MFRQLIRVSFAVLIPTLTAAILSGCTPTHGGGSTGSDAGESQFMGDMDGEAWVPNAQTASNKETLPDPQAAEGHYAD